MKCRCSHLLTRHAGFGRCHAERSTPGGRVHRCNCEEFRSKEVDALRAAASTEEREAITAHLETVIAQHLVDQREYQEQGLQVAAREVARSRATLAHFMTWLRAREAFPYCPCTEEYNGGMTGPPADLKHTEGCPYARRD